MVVCNIAGVAQRTSRQGREYFCFAFTFEVALWTVLTTLGEITGAPSRFIALRKTSLSQLGSDTVSVL